MNEDLSETPPQFDDIDWNNYIPHHRSYNTIVFYHKKMYADAHKNENQSKTETTVNKIKRKIKKRFKEDKSQQFNSKTLNDKSTQIPVNVGQANLDLGKSNKFTNNIVPLPILTNDTIISEPLYFTIKTTKKHKKHANEAQEQSIDEKLVTYKKQKSDKLKTLKPRVSINQGCNAGELFDSSSQNTLEDLHLNINQSSSYSEISESKCRKREHSYEKGIHNTKKILISNSFHALATESCNGEGGKIKIQLMNESDKKLLCESIQGPICTAIKELLNQTPNQCSINSELETIQKALQCNSQKLDEILQRVTCIEKKIGAHTEMQSKPAEIASESNNEKEDIYVEDNLSEEFDMCQRRVRARDRSVVISLDENFVDDIHKKETNECTQEASAAIKTFLSNKNLGVRPDRPNKIPTKFCWSDTNKLK